jgi:hypothetical protein
MFDRMGTTTACRGGSDHGPCGTAVPKRCVRLSTTCVTFVRTTSANGQGRPSVASAVNSIVGGLILITCHDAGGTGQPRQSAVIVEQVEQSERNILGVCRKRLCGDRTRFFRGPRLRTPRAQVSQRDDPPFTYNPLGMFDHRREDTPDTVVFGAYGTEREGEVAFFGKAMSPQNEELIIRPRCFTVRENALKHGLDDVPDLRPDFMAALPERLRMLAAQDLGVGVVVEHDELVTPVDHDRKARAEADADCGT